MLGMFSLIVKTQECGLNTGFWGLDVQYGMFLALLLGLWVRPAWQGSREACAQFLRIVGTFSYLGYYAQYHLRYILKQL